MYTVRTRVMELGYSSLKPYGCANNMREARNNGTWRKVEEVFHAALAVPVDKRAEFLLNAVPDDTDLRTEVRSLLEAYESDNSLLDSPAAWVLDPSLALQPGDRLGSFEIIELLGRGGMGEVYRARDLRLGREVAIKVLGPGVSDVERRRFLQEAQTASALNHPNIVTVYDVGSQEDLSYMAMECVTGKTLDAVIPARGMPLPDALKIADQVASALAEAHAAGIVHRDLKPNNVMVSGSGAVKVLDFGLAKRIERPGPDHTTQTASPKSDPGMILGTLGYMSPEQAEGRPVDLRSDIFSFGSILYEMVSGTRAFRGNSSLATLAAIVRDEPAPLGADVPAGLRKIISRCLNKDRDLRYQHVLDVKLALAELRASKSMRGSRAWAPGVAASVVLFGLILGKWLFKERTPNPAARGEVIPLVTHGWVAEANFSRDGNQVVFSWDGERQDNFDIYVKLIGTSAILRLTSDPAEDRCPAFSPDGREVGFIRQANNRQYFMTVPAIGGSETSVAEIPPTGRFDWLPDGKRVVIDGLKLLTLATGEVTKLTSAAEGSTDMNPAISPDGRMVAFSRRVADSAGDLGAIYLLDLDKEFRPKSAPRRLTFLQGNSGWPTWSADGRHIVFHSGVDWWTNSLWRIPTGESATPEHLSYGQGEFPQNPQISPTGDRFLYERRIGDYDIWRLPLSGSGKAGAPPSPFISSNYDDLNPRFSRDGKWIAMTSVRGGTSGIWVSDAEGSSVLQVPLQIGRVTWPAWSPDGQRLAYNWGSEIYTATVGGGSRQRLTRNTGRNSSLMPEWSHDGAWIYFTGFREGGHDVWKVPAKGGEAVQLTKTGGGRTLESPDGKFIYYSRNAFAVSPLYRTTVGGEGEVQVLPAVGLLGSFAVVPEGIYFYSGTPSTDGKHWIQFLSFRTGKTTAIFPSSSAGFLYLEVSPDGRTLLYSRLERSGVNLMLVDHFQ